MLFRAEPYSIFSNISFIRTFIFPLVNMYNIFLPFTSFLFFSPVYLPALFQ